VPWAIDGCNTIESVNEPTRLRVPVHLSGDREWLGWDAFGDREPVWIAGVGVVDEIARLARPRPTGSRIDDASAVVLGLAQTWGPMSWCSTCERQHELQWRMTAPDRPKRVMQQEPVADWLQVAAHINALRRLEIRLHPPQVTHGEIEDWDVVWPDRPGSKYGPDPDLKERDDLALERPGVDFGEVAREKRQVAKHLSAWLASCHVGRAVAWELGPLDYPVSGSLLGDIGSALATELTEGLRVRACSGVVRGLPCRATWSYLHDKPRAQAPADLCAQCYALYRQQKHQEGTRT